MDMTTATLDNQKIFRKSAVPSSVVGVALFVATELMFFTALISAFLVIKSGYGYWAPPEGIKLPMLMTAINTGFLMLSGILLFLSGYANRKGDDKKALTLMIVSSILGLVFFLIQGYEWMNLIKFGFTMQTSVFAGTFFLLIGAHGLHVLAAVLILGHFCRVFYQKGVVRDTLTALQIMWFFVVGIWPVLYGLVYF
jgi:heme/copper-type cytochrome/quinol oxidase subunit 3